MSLAAWVLVGGIVSIIIGLCLSLYALHKADKEWDRYWSLDWEHPDENISETCHRLRVPPPRKF